jgi:hypothetical protein
MLLLVLGSQLRVLTLEFFHFVLLQPGQSFSFQVRNAKGQKVLSESAVKGATPLGLDY